MRMKSFDVMTLYGCFCAFFGLAAIETVWADTIYFPLDVVNVTLPAWKRLARPIPPIASLHSVSASIPSGLYDVVYAVVSESTSGLFIVEGDEIRLNELFLPTDDAAPSRQFAVVSVRSGSLDLANATVNLELTGKEANCEEVKRNLCFWDGASYRVLENRGLTLLGELSSRFYRVMCPDYKISYDILKGEEYLEIKTNNRNVWMLYSKNIGDQVRGSQMGFVIKCTASLKKRVESFSMDFQLNIVKRKELNVTFRVSDKVLASKLIYQNSRVATGLINDPGGKQLNLKFSLGNNSEDRFDMKCQPRMHGSNGSAQISRYECGITAERTFHLKTPYSLYVLIEDESLPSGDPNRFHVQNITLHPFRGEMEKRFSRIPKNSEESFMLDLNFPEFGEISGKAVAGTRVAEPTVGTSSVGTESRKKVMSSGIKFQVLTTGPFNVTDSGGIVFVSNPNLLKETTYRIKITGVYPDGYRFFSTMEINITDSKSPLGSEICGREANESRRPSCSEKRNRKECEKTCGVSSGRIKRYDDKSATTSGCLWRSNENPEKLSRLYQTCSPDLSTCPDRFCDPLEKMFPKICPQDCTEYVFGSANKENLVPGIASATGVCTCDNRQKCLCSLLSKVDAFKQSERRKAKQIINDTVPSRNLEAISAVKASYTDQCGTVCLMLITCGGIVVVCATSAILLMTYRRKMRKRCPNQRPLKEDLVNINYEEYVDRPGDVLRPSAQTATIKEIPEYYDKKWEFPRHRLTIEETLGEGEFGKVLKARADGIGGNDGSTTVAVKTLKDSARESELADLISEYQLLKEIDHPNVIHLLGACTKLDGPVYIIIEYAKHGSLRNYLRLHRHLDAEPYSGVNGDTSYLATITPKDILTFAWQIAKGMNYLTDMKLVHRDLAARNVLVADGLICKISDFGLTRDIYEDDTYLKRSKGRVPVKWMALESLADHVYTTKSDVWSYGVVLWELVTTGASPYPGIAGQNLFHLLKSGYRMEKPHNCSNELYGILRSCWQENPSHRPTFKSLVAKFEEMLGEGKDYLDLNPRTVENKTYFSDFLNEDAEMEAFVGEEEQKIDNKIFNVKFELIEKPSKPQQCGKCLREKCECERNLRYENGTVLKKPKYENDGMEDTGYMQPSARPKEVDSRQSNRIN